MTRDEFLKAVTREIGGTFNHEVLDARIKVMDATLKVAAELVGKCKLGPDRGRCNHVRCHGWKDHAAWVLETLTAPARKESR